MSESDDKKINCVGCNLFMGVIRDAKLKKEIYFLCPNCNTKRVASDLAKMTTTNKNPFEEFMGAFTAPKGK